MMNIPYVRGKLRKIWPGLPSTWSGLRHALSEAALDVGRLALATVLGYLATVRILPGRVDLTGALSALLITQASLRGSFRAGMVRVLAVLTGIGVALVVSTFVGLQWWSLGIVVFAGLMMAKVLRLEGNSLEVAVSAMLILAASGADVAAFNRFATTMIGTLVGIGLPLLLPRRVRTVDLTRDLRRVAFRIREIYVSAALHLAQAPMTEQAASHWLASTRAVTPLVASATTILDEAADVQKWNTRQVFQADVVPLVRHGLEALERVGFESRVLFHTVELKAQALDTEDDGQGEQVRAQFVALLSGIGRSVSRFADLIEAEASGHQVDKAEQRLAAALQQAHDAQDRLTAAMRVDSEQTELWLSRGSVLSLTEQILHELDLKGFVVRRDAWRASQLGRLRVAGSIGPRIRSPWGLIVQSRLRRRAAVSRLAHPEGSHEVTHDQTTVLMPAVEPAATRDEQRRTQLHNG